MCLIGGGLASTLHVHQIRTCTGDSRTNSSHAHTRDPGGLGGETLLLLIVITILAFTLFVVFVERGQRRITVNYARRQGGRNAYMNQTSFLPLKLNILCAIVAAGAVGWWLDARKARILLQLCLAAGMRDAREVQALFDRCSP